MSNQVSMAPAADMAGLGFSASCVIHCLALPILAAILPVAGVLADMEAVHKGLVVFAAVAAGVAIAQGPAKVRLLFAGIAMLGVGTLAAGAFIEALHDLETPLTVAGALILGGAHILRWRTLRLGEHHS